MTLFGERSTLFGRAKHIGTLKTRVQSQGLTVVTGHPKMGKTWFLRALADELLSSDAWLVGYYESSASEYDHLGRALSDLYTRWLADSSLSEGARTWLARKRGELGAGMATFLAEVLAAAADVHLPAFGGAVSKGIATLKAQREDFRAGGFSHEPVSYTLVHELVRTVAAVSGRRILLILDAWEQNPNPVQSFGALKKFLGNLDLWPEGFHVIIVLRDTPEYAGCIDLSADLCSSSWAADTFELLPMDVGADSDEGSALLSYLKARVPAAEEVSSDTLFGLLGGNPAVLEAWVHSGCETIDDLLRVAGDANTFRYAEFRSLLPELLERDECAFVLAVRLAFLPELTSSEIWEWDATAGALLGCEATEAAVAGLVGRGVLHQAYPPCYGHRTRHEAARSWLANLRTCRPHTLLAVRDLIADLSAQIRFIDGRDRVFAASLASMRDASLELQLPAAYAAACSAAASLFRSDDQDEVFEIADMRSLLAGIPDAPALAAAVLVNTMHAAKLEEDLARRDTLLEELRGLAESHAEDAAVREKLAIGLFNTMNDAKSEEDLARRDTLLEELRGLGESHAEDAAVRERLAMGLFNTMNDAKSEEDLARRDTLLEELRGLGESHAEDAAVRERLAMGLFNTMNDAKSEEDLARRDTLLEELRGLGESHAEDAAVRERLAMGLFNTMNAAKLEEDLARRDTLLEELRGLAESHAEDAAVRERLAMGLFNTMNAAKSEEDLARRDTLLEELRGLAESHAEDAAVREQLAMGLFNTMHAAKLEEDLARRDTLLEELRGLGESHAEDAAVREKLAMGLVNTMHAAKSEEDLARRDTLLEELRGLGESHAEDAAVREKLAMGLFNTMNDAKSEEDLARRDTLLEELRGLGESHAEDAAVRERLAMGLFNTMNDAKSEEDLARRDTLLEELRGLGESHAEDAAVRERLAMGLFNTMHAAKLEEDLARRDTLLEELRGLGESHAEDAAVREQLAMGLFNTMHAAKLEEDLARRDTLLEELRGLAESHAEDAAVREQLAMGLFNTMHAAKSEEDLARCDTLLEELRGLGESHAEDAAVSSVLAHLKGVGLTP